MRWAPRCAKVASAWSGCGVRGAREPTGWLPSGRLPSGRCRRAGCRRLWSRGLVRELERHNLGCSGADAGLAVLDVLGRAQGIAAQELLQDGAAEIGLADHHLEHEGVAQAAPGAVNDHLGGSGSKPQSGGDLFRREAEMGDHGDRGGIPPGEAGHAALHLFGQLAQLCQRAWAALGVRRCLEYLAVEQDDAAPGPEVVGGEVARNRQQPGTEAGWVVEAAQTAQRPDESVLHHIGDGLAVTDLACRYAPDGARMSSVKFRKGLCIASPDGFDELGVAPRQSRGHHDRMVAGAFAGPAALAVMAATAVNR